MFRNFQAQLGTIAIGLGGVGGALAVLDWMLSQKSKNWIENKASTVWIWLSYQQTWPLVRKLQNERVFAVFLAAGCAVWVLLTLFIAYRFLLWLVPWRTIENLGITMMVLLSVGTVILCLITVTPALLLIYATRARLRWGYSWTTTASGGGQLLLRAFGVFAVSATVLFAIPMPHGSFLGPLIAHPVFFVMVMMIYFILTLSLTLIYFALGILCCYIVGIYVLIACFRIAQTFILRIVEYDKGPVLAISALLAAMGSILTAFSR
jgi:hypothetical protein